VLNNNHSLTQNPKVNIMCQNLTYGIVSTHNSLWIDMLPYSDTLSWFWANQSLFFLLNAVCLAEKQQIPIQLYSRNGKIKLEKNILHAS
jgi:hypothetical protein